MPVRVVYEPYLFKVLNSVPYTNNLLCKIGYVSSPNCCLFVFFFGIRLQKLYPKVSSAVLFQPVSGMRFTTKFLINFNTVADASRSCHFMHLLHFVHSFRVLVPRCLLAIVPSCLRTLVPSYIRAFAPS